jgi:hypothetical protein
MDFFLKHGVKQREMSTPRSGLKMALKFNGTELDMEGQIGLI